MDSLLKVVTLHCQGHHPELSAVLVPFCVVSQACSKLVITESTQELGRVKDSLHSESLKFVIHMLAFEKPKIS